MIHGLHSLADVFVVRSTGKKARLGIRRTFPGQPQTSDRVWGRPFGFSATRFESGEAGSLSNGRRGAHATLTVPGTALGAKGCEMTQMWHLPCR